MDNLIKLKNCPNCGPLHINQFNKKKTAKDGLQPHCKKCQQKAIRTWYAKNKEHQKKTIYENRKKRIGVSRKNTLDYLRIHPCVDCGEADVVVLDFDHITDNKVEGISKMITDGISWKI